MSKLKAVVSCPADTYSGYGARARDFVKALIALDKYDVKILSQRWGNTRFGYLKDHGEDELSSLIIPQLTSKPDIWIQITVPNEFQAVGKYNIGVTAGIETTICDATWIEGCNRMDLILTSSEHSKKVFQETSFEVTDNNTKKVINNIKLTKPVEVLLEGADIDKYKVDNDVKFDLSLIPESFCYLFVGHWLKGDIREDRKNVGFMIKAFLETFKNIRGDRPALILKTSSATTSIMDREAILDKIRTIRNTVKGNLPNIYLVHGDLTDQEMNALYNNNKVKAMISFTKGEGFGRPLLEFSLVKKPIIASAWSGHIDFLNPEQAMLVGGDLNNVHPSAVQDKVILKESKWFQVDDGAAGRALKEMYKHYKEWIPKAKKLGYKNSKEFSFSKMTNVLKSYTEKYIPEMAAEVQLQMPTMELPKLS